MNLREAIGEYAVHYGRCQEVIGWEGEGVERIRRQFGEVQERLYRIVNVAEAAIALSEHQAFTAFNPEVEAVVYYQERDKLWRAFMEAHKAAKEVDQT